MPRPQTVEIAPRDKILDAAEALFARRGYAGVGLSEIAEAVGLGKSSLFHHFRSKAQLYAAVASRILVHIDVELARALAEGGAPADKLERWVDTLIDLLGHHPTYSRLLLRSLFENDEFGGALDEERQVNEMIARILDNIMAVLREGMAQGDLHEASLPDTVQSLVGLIVYHFASGFFGGQLFQRPLFDPSEVHHRKQEVKALLRHGLIRQPQEGQTR